MLIEDLIDTAALFHSHHKYGPTLRVHPRSAGHEMFVRQPIARAGEDQEAESAATDESNEKLALLADAVRPRLPLLAHCSITEKSGAFTVRIVPASFYKHYPRPGPNDRPAHSTLDPIRAMMLVQKFESELAMSGH